MLENESCYLYHKNVHFLFKDAIIGTLWLNVFYLEQLLALCANKNVLLIFLIILSDRKFKYN